MKIILRSFALIIQGFCLLYCYGIFSFSNCLAETSQAQVFCEKMLNIAKMNKESIRNWRGTLLVEQKFFDPQTGKSLGQLQANIDFAVDIEKNMRISVSKISNDKQVENGELRERPHRITGFLFRDGLTYAFEGVDPRGPIVNPDNVFASPTAANIDLSKPYVKVDSSISPANLIGNVRIIPGMSEPMILHFPSPDFYDPLDGVSLGKMHWLNIASLVTSLKTGIIEDNMVVLEINNNSNTTILRLMPNSRDSQKIITEYEFDKNGLCIREYCGESIKQNVAGRYECIAEKKYVQIKGIWVPSKIKVVFEHAKWSYEYTFNKQIINEPLEDDIFSLKNLGVKQGDYVKDLRTDEFYQINDNSLPKQDFEKYLVRPSKYPFVRYILIVLGSIMISLALFNMYRKRQADRKEVT